jgi:cell division protein FtsB
MVTAGAATLADALAAIRELEKLVQKQAVEIANLQTALATARAEIATLKSENAVLKAENAALKAENAALRGQIVKLESENAWLKRQVFGSKSERFIPGVDQSVLLPGFEEEEPDPQPAMQSVAEHTRKVREQNGWDQIPADIPREDRIIDVPEEKRRGMELIGYEDSERLAVRSGLYVIRYRRAKYADPKDALRGVVTAPAPGDFFNSPSGRTKYDVSQHR